MIIKYTCWGLILGQSHMLKKIANLDFKNISLSQVTQPHFDHSEFRKRTITDAGKKSHQGQMRLIRHKTAYQ